MSTGPSIEEFEVAIDDLSLEATQLLRRAVADRSRNIVRTRAFEGLTVAVGDTLLSEPGNRRSEARWQRAADELTERRLIRDLGKGTVFEVTLPATTLLTGRSVSAAMNVTDGARFRHDDVAVMIRLAR